MNKAIRILNNLYLADLKAMNEGGSIYLNKMQWRWLLDTFTKEYLKNEDIEEVDFDEK